MHAPRQIIALYSPTPGHGKTTVAKYLGFSGYELLSFAAPLRRMTAQFLVEAGVAPVEAWEYLTARKEEVVPEIGVTGRHLLRTIGTEWGRDHVSRDIWLKCWLFRASHSSKIVVDDLRFPNELELLRSLGAKVWLVTSERGQAPVQGPTGLRSRLADLLPSWAPLPRGLRPHRSDGALDYEVFDRVIDNNGTLFDLRSQVAIAVSQDFNDSH